MNFLNYKITNSISIALLLFLSSCAQQVTLTGGKEDKTAPIEKETSPLNGSVNFNSNTVTIEFDEFVQLRNLSSQLIVSPIIDPKPEISVKGKKVVIKLPDNLSPNTTYSINFGSSIMDITENNSILNYKYVFSTGDFLDSLAYRGTVVNAFDLTPEEKVYVMLYANHYDSIPYKEIPNYVALTDKNGDFEITNIANGVYKIFVLNDINSNYLFDLPNEEIAFKEELLTLNESNLGNRLELFEEDNALQYIKKSSNKNYGEYKVEFNKPVNNFGLRFTDNSIKQEWVYFLGNEAKTNFSCWVTGMESINELEILFTDNDEVIDTVDFNIIPVSEFLDTTSNISTNITPSFDLNKNIVLSLKRPFQSYEKDKIVLYEDSVIVPFKIQDISVREIEIVYDFKEDTKYNLFIPAEAFIDIYGLKNDTLIKQFKTKEMSDYGLINLNLTPNFTDKYILQLYRGKNVVDERSFSGNQQITYEYLKAGDFGFKLIIDQNNNKKWDTGKYLLNKQPEKVIYYEKPIQIRANWDNDINWTIIE